MDCVPPRYELYLDIDRRVGTDEEKKPPALCIGAHERTRGKVAEETLVHLNNLHIFCRATV